MQLESKNFALSRK